MMIIKDSKGNELLNIIEVDEANALKEYAPVTHALLVVKVGDEYLMGWNHWRQNWEIFGGCRDEGENLRECVIREAYEELGLENVEFTYLGLMHYRMAPGYFNPQWHEEYGALYGISLPGEMLDVIKSRRQDKEEIEKLVFYSQIKEEPVAQIDEKLLEYWKN